MWEPNLDATSNKEGELMARIEGDRRKLTPLQVKLWNVLSDGKLHLVDELLKVIDEQAEIGMLRTTMSSMRTKIRSAGDETIIFEDGGYRKAIYVKEIPFS
jgi:hypothetical protein